MNIYIYRFCDLDLLTNIRKGQSEMTVNCQAGSTSTDLIGNFEPLEQNMWYNPYGIANVISFLKYMRWNKAEVEYVSEKDIFVTTAKKNNEGF